MYRFEVLFTLFLVTQPTLGTAYTPKKLFNPRKHASVNQVARRDCVPAAPNVSAPAMIADACSQNNQVDPRTCSDEIAKSIQQSQTSTCNVYSNLYKACRSSHNGSLNNCSDSLLGYQECSNYTIQAYAYCGCYYSLPTELSACANEQLQNQTAGSDAVPISSTSSILVTTLVPPPIVPIGPATPPPQTPILTTILPPRETSSTSWITNLSTMYPPIESPLPSTINPPETPVRRERTSTIITTLSIPEPAPTTHRPKHNTEISHSASPPPTPALSTKTLTLTLLSTITIHFPGPTPKAPSIYLSAYTSTILTTISYTPTQIPFLSPSPSPTSPPPSSTPIISATSTISITETTTIFTNLIDEPINTVALFTLVSSGTTSASTAAASRVVGSGIGGIAAGNKPALPALSTSGGGVGPGPVLGGSAKPGPALGGGGGGGWCARCGGGGRRKKRSSVMPAAGVVARRGSGGGDDHVDVDAVVEHTSAGGFRGSEGWCYPPANCHPGRGRRGRRF